MYEAGKILARKLPGRIALVVTTGEYYGDVGSDRS
jgi:hypothetical protein